MEQNDLPEVWRVGVLAFAPTFCKTFLFSYLERQRGRDLLSAGSLPKGAQQLRLGWAKARSQELHPAHLCGHLLPPRVGTSTNLDLEVYVGLEPTHSKWDAGVSQAVSTIVLNADPS